MNYLLTSLITIGLLFMGCVEDNDTKDIPIEENRINTEGQPPNDSDPSSSNEEPFSSETEAEEQNTDNNPPEKPREDGVAQSPIEFLIENNSSEMKYVSVDGYDNTPDRRMIWMKLERLVDGQWQKVNTYYNNLCEDIRQGGTCTYIAEGWRVIQDIEPGEQMSVIWEGYEFVKSATHCGETEGCYEMMRPIAGQYRFNIDIGDGCESYDMNGNCVLDSGLWTFPTGEVTYSYEFDVPFEDEQLVCTVE